VPAYKCCGPCEDTIARTTAPQSCDFSRTARRGPSPRRIGSHRVVSPRERPTIAITYEDVRRDVRAEPQHPRGWTT
jgi:hypothetical protein